MPAKKPEDDARAKFLEALEKKKIKGESGSASGPDGGSKVGGGKASDRASKRIQRKSGSA